MKQLLVMEKHNQIIRELKSNLESIGVNSDHTLQQLELAIKLCKGALDKMRDLVFIDSFPDQDSEIYFFKKLKPEVYSKLLYYLRLFEIQSNIPSFDTDSQIQYYKKRMKKCIQFTREHQNEVEYFQYEFTYLDRSYFTRNNLEIPLLKRNEYYLIDEKFHTWYDHTFSEIIANQMLLKYIQNEIVRLKKIELGIKSIQTPKSRWTGDKVYLIELAYGMYYTGMINNGQTEIKTIVDTIAQLFDVNLDNHSRTFHDIKRRKIDRTKFLDIMKSKLENKMDEFDR